MTEHSDTERPEGSTTEDEGPLQFERADERNREGEDDSDDPGVDQSNGGGRNVVTYVQYSLFVLLLVVVLIATLRFYFAASTAVDRFVSDQYRPVFQAAFNLAILLASGLGISLLVRRMR